MGLNDLMNEIKQDPNNFLGDEATENKVLRQVMTLVEDKISEVKNQAVKWYVPLDIRFAFSVSVPPAWANSSKSFESPRWTLSWTNSSTSLPTRMRS